MSSSTELLVGFAFDLLVAVIIVRGIYYPTKRDKSTVFTFLALNTIIYFVMSLLTSIELSVGAGFGLFAIFSVLRYRTSTVVVRDMTYLFILVGLSVVNATMLGLSGWDTLLSANIAIIGVLYVLEKGWGFRFEQSKPIIYKRIDLIKPEHEALLLADLRERTGLAVKRVEIEKLNFLRESAELRIFYDSPSRDG
jgi:hypothetical protein